MKDPYETLGVDASATPDDIKSAFRKKAMEHHPDRNPGDAEAERKFKEVNAAHAILSDPQKKADYDRSRSGPGFFGQGFGQGFGFGFGQDFSWMGQGFGRRRRATEFRKNGADVERTIEISLEEVNAGVRRQVDVPTESEVACPSCNATGAERGAKSIPCASCSGTGREFTAGSDVCRYCSGRGEVPLRRCKECGGRGSKRLMRHVTMKIPVGISEGQRLRLAGQGEPGAGGAPGDLYVTVHVLPHERFERRGDDLLTTATVSLASALKRRSITVRKLDGTSLVLTIPESFTAGSTVLRVKHAGMASSSLRESDAGDMLVTIHITVPPVRTARAARLIEELLDELGE